MLRTRLWMGALLVALVVGVLAVDASFAPGYPILLALVAVLALAGTHELRHLLEERRRPPAWLAYGGVGALVVSNWVSHVVPNLPPSLAGPWPWVTGTFAAVVLSAFLHEMAVYRGPGDSVTRMALTVWLAAYLGLLTSFFAQLRWRPGGGLALALAIFVPKFCDVGAYFTGRFLGRHKMTPVLSPKKTWEGFAGGLAAAVLTTLALDRLGPAFPGPAAAVGFGLAVGVAGVLGDLAESLVKRDCEKKDASQTVPGFGGVLDVVDSVVFAAPVAYWWLTIAN